MSVEIAPSAPCQRSTNSSPVVRNSTPVRERLLALDVFRGLTLVGMIFVNNQGSGQYTYPFFAHVAWNGCTLADVIFPFFLFIVGTAIPYSLDSARTRGISRRAILGRILRRSILLFAIGVAMNGYPFFDFSTIRICGILQRIAICYFCVSWIYLTLGPRGQAVLGAAILLFYWMMMQYIPLPGGEAGILEPTRNWAHWLDAHLLRGHMQFTFWESKGFGSTVPALVTTLMGAAAGRCLRSSRSPLEKTCQLYLFGAASLLLGVVWSLTFPINQSLWTSSLVLFVGGMALLLLASCYYVVDIKRSIWWTPPLVAMGMNSIAVWVLTKTFARTLELIPIKTTGGTVIHAKEFLFGTMASWTGPWTASWLFAVANVLFWLGVMGLLYRWKIFFKV